MFINMDNESINEHRYMRGNLVENGKGDVVKIAKILDNGILSEEEEFVDYNDIKQIPITDAFLKHNGFEFANHNDTFLGNIIVISPPSYYGPAITRRFADILNIVEYSIAGIVLNTIDELQNQYNICGCSSISDKFYV